MTRVLITGGAGFIGSHLVRVVLDCGYDVAVLDKLTYAGRERKLDSVRDRVTFHQGDITDRSLVREVYSEVDYVVNLAAETHVDRSIECGEPFVDSNVKGGYVLMDELRNTDVRRMVHVSTDEVYGSTESGMFHEEDPLDPSSPYAASKAAADMFATAMVKTYDLPITVVRPTNAFGPRQHPEKLIPKMTLRALANEALPLYGDGANRRNWLYVTDVCRALVQLLEQGENRRYNLDGGTEKKNIEVVEAILDDLDKPHDLIEFVQDRPGHDYRYAVDDSRLSATIDFEPEIDFETGLARTVKWFRDHQGSGGHGGRS